ncbi:unnamed protein product, partial [Mesorhabditis belari]|uniref:Uncharacterized protein n=1 Tax=Mesorhabditis belari TaxID=2138241 RepID=A0AAF3J4S9_9BILA
MKYLLLSIFLLIKSANGISIKQWKSGVKNRFSSHPQMSLSQLYWFKFLRALGNRVTEVMVCNFNRQFVA